MRRSLRFLGLLSVVLIICLVVDIGAGVAFILLVTPHDVDMTITIRTTDTASPAFTLQINLTSPVLVNPRWEHTTNPHNLTVEAYPLGIQIIVAHPAPQTVYQVSLLGLQADSNETGYWGVVIQPDIPSFIEEVAVGVFQVNLRLGLLLTIDNEWGSVVRYAFPASYYSLSGRTFDEQTFLMWTVLAASATLLALGTIETVVVARKREYSRAFSRRAPFFSISVILITVFAYILLGPTGMTQSSVFSWMHGTSLSPASLYWQLPPVANLLSCFLHADFSHVTGNMLGFGMLGVLLMEVWMRVPRRGLFLVYFSMPLIATVVGLLRGGLGVGASDSIGASIAFGLVVLAIEANRRGLLVIPRPLSWNLNTSSDIRQLCRWVWTNRNLWMTLLFGYVTVAYLWGWTGTFAFYWHLIVLNGFQESWFGEMALAVGHLVFYLAGIGEAIVFYKVVRPILLRRRLAEFGRQNIKDQSSAEGNRSDLPKIRSKEHDDSRPD